MSRRPYLWAVLLAALVLWAYWPALHGAFIWDDDRLPALPLLSLPGALAEIWRPGGTLQFYPATFTTFWIERRLWGLAPTGFHAVNFALHIANAALAGLCLRRLGLRAAWLAALIFAVHPVHAESVAWISERKNVLSAFFYLLSLLCFLRYEEDLRRRWYAASLGLFLLALLSKTMVCTLPAALLLLRWARGRDRNEGLKELLPFFALAAAAGVVTAATERAIVGASGPEFQLSLAQKLLVASRGLWFHFGKLLWPARLSFSYEPWQIAASDLAQWLWPALTAAAAAAVWRARLGRGRLVVAAPAYFAVTLFPALGFFPVYTFRFSYVADHYQYLASLGLIALGASALRRAKRWREIVVVVVVSLSVLTRRQAALFADSESLWKAAVRNSPRSALAHNNLGVSLNARGRGDEALEHFQTAARLMPGFEDAYFNAATVFVQRRDFPAAELALSKTLAIQPNHVLAHSAFATVLADKGLHAQAVPHYLKVLELRPGDAQTCNQLGAALGALGRTEAAIAFFRRALSLRPDYATARRNLDLAMKARGSGRR